MDMQSSESWMQSALLQVCRYAEIEPDEQQLTDIVNEDMLQAKLEELVSWLLDKDFEKLLWILYRVDVDEQRTKEILAQHVPADAPHILATLILERQKQKEEIRRSFQQAPVADEDEDLLL